MAKFWNWSTDEETGERTLRLEGAIVDDDFLAWLYDGVSAKAFRDELNSGEGDVTVHIHSEGGDCFAAAAIYSALKEYGNSKGLVTVKIDGMAASAASVVAMAGDVVEISPVGIIMIHNPWTGAVGDSAEMKTVAQMLDEVKETIINAYEAKTKLSREEISRLMDEESYFHAQKAVKYGFADKIIGDESAPEIEISSKRQIMNCAAKAIMAKISAPKKNTEYKQAEEKSPAKKRVKPVLSHRKLKVLMEEIENGIARTVRRDETAGSRHASIS